MKTIKQDIKYINTMILSTLTVLTLFLLTGKAHADETNTELEKMCDRQSILIAAEMKSKSEEELSVREVTLIRLGAINACKKTYIRMTNSPDFVKSSPPEKEASAKTGTDKNQKTESKAEEESIFDRLLRTEKKEDVSPMQKRHRTGGK